MIYSGHKVLIATKHQKESVIRPFFDGVICKETIVAHNFDTDQFGTFSGEIKRKKSAFETCLSKAKVAAQQYGYNYVIASEGSFGADPALFFVPSNLEIMVFLDCKNDMVITEQIRSRETNFNSLDVDSTQDYNSFLEKTKFPSHRIIVKELNKNTIIAKGINDIQELKKIMEKSFAAHAHLRLETDMRAMYNPLRMQVIKKLAEKLANRIQCLCPGCSAPGFGQVNYVGNLKCGACGTETQLYKNKSYSCVSCQYHILKDRDDDLQFAEQTYCPYCNP